MGLHRISGGNKIERVLAVIPRSDAVNNSRSRTLIDEW
jgi:hypothetical protein